MNSKKKSQTQSNQPLVSVIMPVYNGEKFVGEAIESVIKQTYENWELIIVDDGSTDNSKEVIDQYISDNRIQYIRHSENKGIPSARNTGLEVSRGEYIALLDHDNFWIPRKLEIQINKFSYGRTQLGLVYGNIKIVDSIGRVLSAEVHSVSPYEDRKKNLRRLFLGNFIHANTVMFKRECINQVGKFTEDITWGGDDYELWLRIVPSFDIGYIDKVLTVRREHAGNYSDPKRMLQGSLRLTHKVITTYPILKDLKAKKIARITYKLGRYRHNRGDFNKAREFYLEAILTCFIATWKPYLAYLLTFLGLTLESKVIRIMRRPTKISSPNKLTSLIAKCLKGKLCLL